MLANLVDEIKTGTTVSVQCNSHRNGVAPVPVRRTTTRVENSSVVSLIVLVVPLHTGAMVGREGLEPPTSRLSSACSNPELPAPKKNVYVISTISSIPCYGCRMKVTVFMIQAAWRAEYDYHQKTRPSGSQPMISTPDKVIRVMLEAAMTHAGGTTLQPLRTGQAARLQRSFNPVVTVSSP